MGDQCQRCSSRKFIYDSNDFIVCTDCGLVYSFDRISDQKIISKDRSEGYSVYDKSSNNDIISNAITSDISSVNPYYKRKAKYFMEFISNYTEKPYYQFNNKLLESIIKGVKNMENNLEGKNLLEIFIKSPTKKNIFKILRSINLSRKIKYEFKSRITKLPLNILKRKNIIIKWNIIRMELIKLFKIENNNFNLIENNLSEILIYMYRFFITDVYYIISRNKRIASPNATVITLAFLYILNPTFIKIYCNIFDLPSYDCIRKNMNYFDLIRNFKYRNIEEWRNIIIDNIPYNITKDKFIQENILNINLEQKKKECKQIDLHHSIQTKNIKMIIQILEKKN